MSSALKVIEIQDPRISTESEPIFAANLGPLTRQNYKIPASGLSNSMLVWGNNVTLGDKRLYENSFEIEYTIEFNFLMQTKQTPAPEDIFPTTENITFRPFPLHSVTDQIRCNINGAACITRPSTWITPRMRYMDQQILNDHYSNVCPIQKPDFATQYNIFAKPEEGINYPTLFKAFLHSEAQTAPVPSSVAPPYTVMRKFYKDTFNIELVNIQLIQKYPNTDTNNIASLIATIREPLLCSPFTSRLDKNYGSALYNITSFDITYTLNDIRNMLFFIGPYSALTANIRSAYLCYTVSSLPSSSVIPPLLTVPYYEHTPYITDYPNNPVQNGTSSRITSGVYTLAQVPQSIYIFIAPNLNELQTFNPAHLTDHTTEQYGFFANLQSNLFGTIQHIEITLGNNTQVLSTYTPYELYRTCKANGLTDSFLSFAKPKSGLIKNRGDNTTDYSYAGTCLRLIPGVDLLVPEMNLIGGSNANQTVFQASVDFTWYASSPKNKENGFATESNIALWVIFDYCGTLSISPGGAKIDMLPIKSLEAQLTNNPPIIASEPTAIQNATGTASGAGFFDTLKSIATPVLRFAKDNKLISKALQYIPGIGPTASSIASTLGYGYRGGAIMNESDLEDPNATEEPQNKKQKFYD